MPTAWKEANVTPVFKDGNAACVENYRPISLLCILSKVLERCIHNHIYDFISSRINKLQHGFQRQKNCTTQLIQVYHNILEALDKRNEIDIIYLDFTKAFDKVSHPLLLQKLGEFGFLGRLLMWLGSGTTFRLVGCFLGSSTRLHLRTFIIFNIHKRLAKPSSVSFPNGPLCR